MQTRLRMLTVSTAKGRLRVLLMTKHPECLHENDQFTENRCCCTPQPHLFDGVHANAHNLRVARPVLIEVFLEPLLTVSEKTGAGGGRARGKDSLITMIRYSTRYLLASEKLHGRRKDGRINLSPPKKLESASLSHPPPKRRSV